MARKQSQLRLQTGMLNRVATDASSTYLPFAGSAVSGCRSRQPRPESLTIEGGEAAIGACTCHDA